MRGFSSFTSVATTRCMRDSGCSTISMLRDSSSWPRQFFDGLHSTSTRTTTILKRTARAKRERRRSAVSLRDEESFRLPPQGSPLMSFRRPVSSSGCNTPSWKNQLMTDHLTGSNDESGDHGGVVQRGRRPRDVDPAEGPLPRLLWPTFLVD